MSNMISERTMDDDGLIAIDKRTKLFAVRIVKLYKYLVDERNEKVLSNQILRSGTSIGANVSEALLGASRADFVNKYNVALKEANETLYWLDLLLETGYLPSGEASSSLIQDCRQIIAILTTSVKTARKNTEKLKRHNPI